MRICLLFILIGLGSCFSEKSRTAKVFVVKTWQVPIQVIPKSEQNRFAEFRQGLIYYRDGKIVSCPLNYSILYGEMQFIDPKGDTLALINEQQVQRVMMGGTEFYSLYGDGYMEVVAGSDLIKLANKNTMKIIWWEGMPKRGYVNYENTYLGDMPTIQQTYNQKT